MPPSRRMLAGVMLIVVFAWAIAAVMLLAQTLSTTHLIRSRVASIRGALQGSDQDLDYVRLTHQTVALADRIGTAARPLSGHLAREIRVTGGILARVRSIDRTIVAIDRTATSIDATAHSIDARVDSINGHVATIEANAQGVVSDAGGVRAHVSSAFVNVLGINGHFRAVRGTVASIDRGVRGTNVRVLRATRTVARIEGNLIAALEQVGLDHGSPADAPIHGHANSIDCRVRGSNCGR